MEARICAADVNDLSFLDTGQAVVIVELNCNEEVVGGRLFIRYQNNDVPFGEGKGAGMGGNKGLFIGMNLNVVECAMDAQVSRLARTLHTVADALSSFPYSSWGSLTSDHLCTQVCLHALMCMSNM